MSYNGWDNNFLEKIKDASDLRSIASRYFPLIQKGRRFWGCCPFHHEKEPSFTIDEAGQFYHCFGCGASGDVISFIQKIECLDFMDAVKLLADRSGIKLPENIGDEKIAAQKKQRDKLIKLLNDAKLHYKENLLLPASESARKYILMRGLSDDAVNEFEIGYSIDFNEMLNYLKNKGYTMQDIQAAGIADKKEMGSYYDTFGGRLLFPINNKFGQCIGFSGRDIIGTSRAKYKNSPATMVFDKSSTVFALDQIKRRKNSESIPYVIIVEGQMDAIALYSAGIKNAVACLGTALTDAHAREISRVTQNVLICFDNDSAGINAAIKSILPLQNNGLDIKIVQLYGGKDPDEIIKNMGVDKFKEMLDTAVDSIEFRLTNVAKSEDMQSLNGKKSFITKAKAILAELKSISMSEMYLPLIKSLTDVPIEVLRQEFIGIVNVGTNKSLDMPIIQTGGNDALFKAQVFVLASLVHKKEYANIDNRTDICVLLPSYQKIFNYIINNKDNNYINYIFSEFDYENMDELKDLVGYDFTKLQGQEEKYFKECLNKIDLFYLQEKQSKLMESYKNCVLSSERVEIAKSLNEVISKINNIKKGGK